VDLLGEITDEDVKDMKRRKFGLYRGIVRDVADPENLGRVRLEVPEVWGGGRLSNWASYCSGFGGGGAGFYLLPRPGDGVWVLFERGEPARPVWIGFWFNSQDKRPEPGGKETRVLRSKAGHRIVFGDEEGKEYVEIQDKAGGFVRIDSAAGEVVVQAGKKVVLKTGADSIGIDSEGDEIVVEAGKSLLLGSASAAEPLVLGKAFKTFFNQFVTMFNNLGMTFDTHTHIGNMGAPTSPPSAPFGQSQQQMADDVLSAKTMTEA